MMLKSNKYRMSDAAIIKEIGSNLKLMRIRKNITQAALSEKSGIDRVTISKLENGRAATLLTLVQILRALEALDILTSFNQEPEISPMQMLQEEEAKYERVRPKKNKIVKKKSEW